MANSRSATLQRFCRFARRPAAALSIPCHPEITAEESYWHWRWKHALINNHRGIRTVFGWNFVEAYQFLLLPLLGRVVSIRYSLLLLMFRGGLCVCQSVFLLVTTVSCAKTEELIKMLFEVWTCVGQTNRVLDGGLIPPGKWQFWGTSPDPLWSTGNIWHAVDMFLASFDMCQVTTLFKLFAYLCLCHQAV